GACVAHGSQLLVQQESHFTRLEQRRFKKSFRRGFFADGAEPQLLLPAVGPQAGAGEAGAQAVGPPAGAGQAGAHGAGQAGAHGTYRGFFTHTSTGTWQQTFFSTWHGTISVVVQGTFTHTV